jgi:hypothetical protein
MTEVVTKLEQAIQQAASQYFRLVILAGVPAWSLNRHVSVDATTRPICDRFAQMRFAKALSSPVGFG